MGKLQGAERENVGQDGSEQEPDLDPALRAPQAGSASVTPGSLVTRPWEYKEHPGSRDCVTVSHTAQAPCPWSRSRTLLQWETI